jgi:hypothetical protein
LEIVFAAKGNQLYALNTSHLLRKAASMITQQIPLANSSYATPKPFKETIYAAVIA